MNRTIKSNVFLNITKQVLSVIYPLITIPYVCRILQAEAYGRVDFARSIVEYFSLIAGLGISNYAVREGAYIKGKKIEFDRFANQVFSINVFFTIISFVGLIGFILLSQNESIRCNKILIIILFASVVLNTIGADWINSIFEDYLYLTLRYLAIQILALVALGVFVNDSSDYVLYAIIIVFSTTGGNVFNVWYIRKYCKLRLTRKIEIKKHFKPIMFLFASSIATTIYINSDITMIGYYLNNERVGVYSVSCKIYFLIKHVINAAITVTIPRLSFLIGEERKTDFENLIGKIMVHIIGILIPVAIGLFFLSEAILYIVGGEQYVDGFLALRILAVSLVFAVISCLYYKCVLLPNKRDGFFLFASVISAFANILLNIWFIPEWGILGAAYTTLISEVLMYILCSIYSRRCIIRVRIPSKDIAAMVVGALLVAVVCMGANIWIENYFIRVFVALIISISVFYLSNCFFHTDIYISIKEMFKRIIFKMRQL